ncbi:MAG: acyl-CoA carboxylase subunit beta, partial [Bacteriovoracaceae bacterium]
HGMYDDDDGSLAGGGLIAGIGFVEGTRIMAVVNNYTVKGGTISPAGLRKILRVHEIVMKNRLPLVTLAESGGANLNYAAEVYIEGARAFANQARLSAMGIPQITVVHGNATAGGAYQPGLSDHIVLIEGQSKMFLAGPPLVKAATGEDANDETLGGAEMHATVSGTGEYLAKNDMEAIGIARDIVKNLGWVVARSACSHREPLYAQSELTGIVPKDSKKPYDVREIILRLADNSEFQEFKGDYESQTICAKAHIMGNVCGLIGNNGPITAKGAGKAAQFIETCEQTGVPLIFLHNTTGFMVGTDSEHSGIIRQGSKMIQAVANSTVQKISFVVGGSFGAGNYAMCGRGFDPDFIFSWPNARTAVMGGEQAGKVLRIISEEKAKKTGEAVDEAKLSQLEKKTAEKLEASSTALFSTAHLWDDGIIHPQDTRRVLGFLLETGKEARERNLRRNSFGVPRH